MRTYLDKDEQALKDLTDSAIAKLHTITDAEFGELDSILGTGSRCNQSARPFSAC